MYYIQITNPWRSAEERGLVHSLMGRRHSRLQMAAVDLLTRCLDDGPVRMTDGAKENDRNNVSRAGQASGKSFYFNHPFHPTHWA